MIHPSLRLSFALFALFLLPSLLVPETALATHPFSETDRSTPAPITTDTLASIGHDLAMDGDYALIGSWQGGAAVFKQDAGQPGSWNPLKFLPIPHQYGGSAVALQGDYAFVGSPFEQLSGAQRGKVYIYQKDAGGPDNWGLVQTLTPSGPLASNVIGDAFGYSLDVDGGLLVVGARGRGSAFVYEFEANTSTWLEVKELQASDAGTYQYVGHAVGVEGDFVMLTAHMENEDGQGANPLTYAGAVYVFQRDEGGANNWGQTQKLVASDRAAYAQFGWHLALDGNYLAIGAPVEANGTGAVYVFEQDAGGPGLWGEIKKLTPSTTLPVRMDIQLALEGDLLLVGTPLDETDENGSNPMATAGSVLIFDRQAGGANNWGQVQKLVASNRDADDFYGYSVAISGGNLLVGAPRHNYEPGTIANPQFGMVY